MPAKNRKTAIEVLLHSADIGGIKLQPRVVKTTRLVTVDLVWPRCTIARKTSAREVKFSRAKADMRKEEWARRILFREEVDGHCGFAVSVSEILDDEWFEKFLRATAKFALREFRDVIKQYTVGISDIASAPLDALAQLEGSYPGPKTVLQGVFDLTDEMLPEEGGSRIIEIPLHRPKFSKTAGSLKLEIRA
jgi:hypothetical protein